MTSNKIEKHKNINNIQQREDIFWSVIENSNQVIIISQDNIVKYFNHKALKWTGYSRQDFMTTPFIDFIHPEDRDTVMQEYQDRLSGKKQSAQYTIRFFTKNGEVRWVDLKSEPLQWDGKPAALALLTDITDEKLVKLELQKSNERFRAFLKNSSEGIWCVELDKPIAIDLSEDEQIDLIFRYAYVKEANDAWARMVGYENGDELIGLRLDEFMPWSMPESITALKELIRSRYNLTDWETVETYPNGAKRIFLNNIAGMVETGRLQRVWGTSRDITAKKEAEERLRDAERRYRMVADFTFDWEYWTDPEGKMLYVSPSCERISGYQAEEFMKNPDLIQEIILKEDRETWAVHRKQARIKLGQLEIQFRICRRDGETRWIEHACQPVHDPGGKFLGVRASNRDITRRKLAEDELKRKDKMLEDAQRIARLGNWEWNIITNTLEWSDEVFQIFGLSPQNFSTTYEAFLESVHADDRENVKQAVNRALSDPSFKYNIMHRIRRPDGSERIVRERGMVTFDDNRGEASRMIGTVQDITDIRKIENEAERLRAELSHMDRVSIMGVLTAGIVHEINQPLAAILSNAQAALRFLKSDPQDLEEVKEALHDIVSDDKRAGEMVHSIRNFVGKYDLKREEIDINETVREVLTLVKSEALNRRIFLSENLQPDILPVYGDRIQIQQVIFNLVMNALEALKGHDISKPEIIVSTRCKENKDVILTVSDSGPGIEPGELDSIFDSFQTTKKEGLGIGLSICRSIADKHEGQLWAENRPEGGAIFFFRLPSGVNRDE